MADNPFALNPLVPNGNTVFVAIYKASINIK